MTSSDYKQPSEAENAFSSGIDIYKVMGVGRKALQEEIRSVYIKHAKSLHPDRIKPESGPEYKEVAEAKFKIISYAYEILSDVESRREYDSYDSIYEFVESTDSTMFDKPSSLRRDYYNNFKVWLMSGLSLTSQPPVSIRKHDPPIDDKLFIIWATLEDIAIGSTITSSDTSIVIKPGMRNGTRFKINDNSIYTLKTEPHQIFRRGGSSIDPGTNHSDLITISELENDKTIKHRYIFDLYGRKHLWMEDDGRRISSSSLDGSKSSIRLQGAGLPLGGGVARGDIFIRLTKGRIFLLK